jgi:hypothetical protein
MPYRTKETALETVTLTKIFATTLYNKSSEREFIDAYHIESAYK